MSRAWQVQEAKARFGELLDATLVEGPQVVTKRGVETAVLLPIEEWRGLKACAKPTIKDLLSMQTSRRRGYMAESDAIG